MKIEILKKTFKIIILSVIVILISVFFMSQKENLDYDEVSTYGLSNNQFQLIVDDWREYHGMEVLLNYAAVKNGNEFNIENVFWNQGLDTHPPIYYMMVNFICSIRKGTFSIWYGLIINIIFMVLLFFEMRYLLNLVIKDEIFSTIISIVVLCTNGFISLYVFTRMYVVATVLSMSFIILILNKMYKNINNILFLILFFLNSVLGVLTHYHFMFIAFIFSCIFGTYLIRNKNYKLLITTFVVGATSLIVSYIIFPSIIDHMFAQNSLHAITNSGEELKSQIMIKLVESIYTSFFGYGLIPYILILVALITIYIISLRKPLMLQGDTKQIDDKNISALTIGKKDKINLLTIFEKHKTYFMLLISIVLFYFFIIATVKFPFVRYLFIIYPLLTIVIIAPIYLIVSRISKDGKSEKIFVRDEEELDNQNETLHKKNILYTFKNNKVYLKWISVVVILMLAIASNVAKAPVSLNKGDKAFVDYLSRNANETLLCVYSSIDKNGNRNTGKTSLWKAHRPIYSLRNMRSIIFADLSRNENLIMSVNGQFDSIDKMFLIVYPPEDDEAVIDKMSNNYGFVNANKIYISNYFHMYELGK